MQIYTVIASNPTEDPANPAAFGLPVTWKLNFPVPGEPNLIVRQIVAVNGEIHVFALPLDGSPMEAEFIKNSGTKQGFRFILIPPHVRITMALAPINEWAFAVQEAMANTDDTYGEPDDGDPDDDEPEDDEPEEEPEENLPPPPPPSEVLPPPPQPGASVSASSFMPVMTPTTNNGQS